MIKIRTTGSFLSRTLLHILEILTFESIYDKEKMLISAIYLTTICPQVDAKMFIVLYIEKTTRLKTLLRHFSSTILKVYLA